MFRTYWPKAKLQKILSEAEAEGEKKITFKTVSDAERFRFACYHLRRVLEDNKLSRLSFSLNTAECAIVVKKIYEPEMEVE